MKKCSLFQSWDYICETLTVYILPILFMRNGFVWGAWVPLGVPAQLIYFCNLFCIKLLFRNRWIAKDKFLEVHLPSFVTRQMLLQRGGSHVNMPVIECSCSWERAWILFSDLKLLKWNPNITFASYTYWIWTVIHVVTGSLKTPRGLCNIFFFCLNLETKIQPNQANSRESIINTDIFHRPGGSGCTYLDDSVLEAPKSFKKR